MGAAFCVLFLVWFVSGIVLIYWRFPHIDVADRLAHAGVLDPAQINISPDQAFRILDESETPSQIRLNVLDGRPVYRFEFRSRVRLVFADHGDRLAAVPQSMALRAGAAWTGLPPDAASFRGLLTEDDQWTVDPAVHLYAPFLKYTWPQGVEVYVSQATGEVVQYTTRGSRLGAYCGAIPHWLYFAPLARHSRVWSRIVECLSGFGALTSLLGLVAGVWVYAPFTRSRIPYSGPKRWHVFLGLVFGTVTCSWVFSGFLSMEPFSWLSTRGGPRLDEALRGPRLNLAEFALKSPRQAIEEAGLNVKELEFSSFDGNALYLAIESPRRSRIVPLRGGLRDVLETGRIVDAVKRAVSPALVLETRVVRDYEIYYVDRQKQQPLPVIYIRLGDRSQSAYYVDPRTGRVVQSYGARSRWNRWLYHGLHSLDLPWLYARRPLWDILVILLLLGGGSLSVTSVAIAWKMLRRTWRARCSEIQ